MKIIFVLRKIRKILCIFIWRIFFTTSLKKKLSNCGIQNISFFQPKLWTRKVAFFTGYINDEKIFIKVGSNIKKIKNEFEAYQNIKNNLHTPERISLFIKYIDFFKFGKFGILISEFLQGNSLDNIRVDENLIPLLENKFLQIIETLHETDTIHRDLRPQNFILHNSDLKLIDFEYGLCENLKEVCSKKEIQLVNHPYNQELGVFDDAYSMYKICQELNFDLNSEFMKNLKRFIGKKVYTL